MPLYESEFKLGLKQRVYNWTMRYARLSRGMTGKDLAKIVGCSVAYISHIETFRVYPSNEKALAICDALNLRFEDVFPRWIRELKLEKVPELTEDKTISLIEAIELGLLKTDEFMIEGWEQQIDTRVSLAQDIKYIISKLKPVEKVVIKSRFGLGGQEPKTLKQLGLDFHVTPERIRQVESKALRKLRHPSISKVLKDYL